MATKCPSVENQVVYKCEVVRADVVLHGTSPKGGAPPAKFMQIVHSSLATAGIRLAERVRFVNQYFDMRCKHDLIANTKRQVQGIRCVHALRASKVCTARVAPQPDNKMQTFNSPTTNRVNAVMLAEWW